MSIKIEPDLLHELIKLGDRLSEDRLYEIAVSEVEDNQFDGVAKAKALEEAEGDQNKARAFYTKHRVRRIRDLIAEQALMAEASRVQAEEERLQKEEQKNLEIKAAEQREKDLQKLKMRKDNEQFGKNFYIIIVSWLGFLLFMWILSGLM